MRGFSISFAQKKETKATNCALFSLTCRSSPFGEMPKRKRQWCVSKRYHLSRKCSRCLLKLGEHLEGMAGGLARHDSSIGVSIDKRRATHEKFKIFKSNSERFDLLRFVRFSERILSFRNDQSRMQRKREST